MTEREHIMPDGPVQPESSGPESSSNLPPGITSGPEVPPPGPGATSVPPLGEPGLGDGTGSELGEPVEDEEAESLEAASAGTSDIEDRKRLALESLGDKEGKDASVLINIANVGGVPVEQFIDELKNKGYDPQIIGEVITRKNEIKPFEDMSIGPDAEGIADDSPETTGIDEDEQQPEAERTLNDDIKEAKEAVTSKDPTKMQKAIDNLKVRIYDPEIGLWRKEKRFSRLFLKPLVSASIATAVIYIMLLSMLTSGATKKVGRG